MEKSRLPQLLLLYGDREDTSLTLPLCGLLSRMGGVRYLGFGLAAEYPLAASRFLLFETAELRCCGAEQALLVLKQGSDYPEGFSPPEHLTVLAQSAKPDWLAAEDGKQLEWIDLDCGAESTLSLSSLRESRAVLELRRTVTLADGTALEPGAFPLELHAPAEGFPLLCCCALRLLGEG
ncbi:MAG: hypothetical protein LBQ33_00045 [Oscillospiraceae bacterium]|nr:hypothetical protein [Oscillospiraceae bacterium]